MAKKARNRANNGMGSIRQRPDGRWEARYTSPDGRQRSVYAKTEAEVTRKLRGALAEIDRGHWREPSKLTVSEWVAIWLRDYQAHNSPQTVQVYSNIMRLHVLPVIGSMTVANVSPLHIRRVISSMGENDMSPQTISSAHSAISTAFRAAVEAKLLQVNPATGVKTPRVMPKRYSIVDREHIPAFMTAARSQKLGRMIIFLLLTGLRIGEARGLKWPDLDMDAGKMYVQRQLSMKAVPGFIPPKDGSAREIDLPQEAVTLLREQRRAQVEEQLASDDWHTGPLYDDLVFRTRNGMYVAETTLRDAVRRVGEKIGLPGLHPHDLRHSYAVAALRSGMDVKTVQHNLGHRSATMTLDTYAAYTTDAGKAGAVMLSEYIQKAVKTP